MENINNPNSWWHKQEVVSCGDFNNALSSVTVKKENGKIIIVDPSGNDITENVILTFPNGNVTKASDYIKMISAH